MKNHLTKWGWITAIIIGTSAAVQAADYLGADGVLQQVVERNAKPEENPPGGDEQTKLRDELKAFSRAATNMAPAAAAKQWLELVDRAVKMQRPGAANISVPGFTPAQFEDLLDALPPPPTWGELAKAIAARPPAKGAARLHEIGLRFLAATLTGDADARNHEIASLSALAKDENGGMAENCRNYLQQIGTALMALSDKPDAVLNSLDHQLAAAAAATRFQQQLEIPNLVAQVGADKAEAFLRKALVTPNVQIGFREPNETSQLAQKLALELMGQLKQPQWGLVNSLSAVGLYEAMEKQFPPATNKVTVVPGLPGVDMSPPDADQDNWQVKEQKQTAQVYYLMGLISKGRTKEAVVVAKKFNGDNTTYMFDEAFKAMQRAGFTEAMDNFFHDLLTQDPLLPFWAEYVEVAAQAGHTARMVADVRSALASADLSGGKKNALHEILFRALLADDNAEAAVGEMRSLMAGGETESESRSLNRGQMGALLARLGVILQKPEWTEEGIKNAHAWLLKPAGRNNSYDSENIPVTLAEILYGLNRGPEAEAVLVDALAAATRQGPDNNYSWRGSRSQQSLAELATIYHKAGRAPDVLDLLEKSPDWGAGDVSELSGICENENLVSLNWLHTGASPLPMSYLAAKALLAEGRNEAAQKIADALLEEFPGLDRGYELLLALQGTNAMARLDELFKRDQFEERPLIWKAHLLREQKQYEAAEKLLRQAIQIDPSDGEEGRGDRMRVYAELAEVRDALGDKKEADFFREVVKAIRMSEDADQLYAVGLLKRAVAMYDEALKHFSDAYCIQSRIAIQLSALGLTAEAEEHYRRAYELMPDSFGRVESHCFGCEKAFDGERPQSIAEKVFTKMAEERPNKPQIHYLLGYLRMEQERYNEARTNYLAAVRLDPDYLNAWVKMQEVSQQILMPPKDRDAIGFNILRLDPLHRHAQPDFERFTDLPGLWNAMVVAAAQQPVVSTNLFELTASKAAMEKKKKEQTRSGFSYSSFSYTRTARGYSPAQAIGETPLVRLAGEMILVGGEMNE